MPASAVVVGGRAAGVPFPPTVERDYPVIATHLKSSELSLLNNIGDAMLLIKGEGRFYIRVVPLFLRTNATKKKQKKGEERKVRAPNLGGGWLALIGAGFA